MAGPFMLGIVGDCGCCGPCGSVCFQEITCGGTQQGGVSTSLVHGGTITGLTDGGHGSNYTAQPYATVSGDGCGAAVKVNWTAPSSGTSGNTTSTGSPATVANNASVGVEAWTIPGAAGALADVALDGRPLGSDTTEYLVLTGLGGLSGISDTASITGMQATISGTLSDSRATDWHAKWCIGGTIEGTDLASGTGDLSAGSLVYGGSSDTAGLTLTGADIKASTSGFAIAFQVGAHTDTVSITSITLKFWWTTPGTGGITSYTLVNGGVGYTTATITVHRGSGDTTGSGASVTASGYSAITTDGTCTTSRMVFSLIQSTKGSGYTNGTGYALGFTGGTPTTSAAGTFDVVSGQVTNLALTNHGAGYAAGSTPTVSFPGAGSGTGAAATAYMGAGCCYGISVSGAYAVKATYAHFQDVCTVVAANCPGNYAQGVIATPNSGYSCCGTSLFAVDTTMPLFLTDANGTHELHYVAGSQRGLPTSGWLGCYTYSGTVWDLSTTGNCGTITTKTGTIAISYLVYCNSGTWYFSMGYATTTNVAGGTTFYPYGDQSCAGTYDYRINSSGLTGGLCVRGNCNGALTDYQLVPGSGAPSSVALTTTTSDPLALSGTISAAHTGCPPFTGSISIST